MANRSSLKYTEAQIGSVLRVYLETGGNCVKAGAVVGAPKQTVAVWAKKGQWDKVLEAQRREVEAQTAAEALRQIVTIRELRVNIHYRALAFIHQRIQEWEEKPAEERGAFPFDPLKLADAMAKADQGTGSGQAQEAPKVEDALATA